MKFVISFIFVCTSSAITLDNFTASNNVFTADIYRVVSGNHNKNILISPISVAILFALLQSGADVETGIEIGKSLRLPNRDNTTDSVIKSILAKLKASDSFEVYSANKIYLQHELQINEDFRKVVGEVYEANIENVDFTNKEIAAANINKWVEDHTNNKIHNILDSQSLDPSTALILVNALYFKGQWQDLFNKYFTKKSIFFTTPDNPSLYDTMFRNGKKYKYYEDLELEASFLELPFKGDQVSMVLVLPDTVDGITNLEKHLDKVFEPHPFQVENVNLELPKFKIADATDLKDVMKKLGVKKAFDPCIADFTGIGGKRGDLVVSEALQKTFINIDEFGVEIEPFPLPGVVLITATEKPKIPIDFIVDRPFLFYVKVKNLILLAGKVVVPR